METQWNRSVLNQVSVEQVCFSTEELSDVEWEEVLEIHGLEPQLETAGVLSWTTGPE